MLSETGAGRSLLVQRMINKGIKIHSNAKVTEVTETTISFEQNGVPHTISDADTLVFAVGYHVDSDFKAMLESLPNTVHMIGDCNKVGSIKEAITDAWNVTKEL
jgi:NADH dehydrogenase FAD-containing subunit